MRGACVQDVGGRLEFAELDRLSVDPFESAD